VTPRAYTQRRRAETAAATRVSIVDAAVEVYREKGAAGATMKAIADRADVSRGTILHHFGDADGLLDAVMDRVVVELDVPDERILEGVVERDARIRRYVEAMVAFFRRSASWWRVFESVIDRPGAKAREAEYFDVVGRLQAAALGPELAGDGALQAAIGAALHPATMGSLLWQLEQNGVPADQATRVVADYVLGFIALRGNGSGRMAS
jgi:AcrR family transcriptional regulator